MDSNPRWTRKRTAPLEYAGPKEATRRRTGNVVWIALAIIGVWFLVNLFSEDLFPGGPQRQEQARRVLCASNMRLIGQAIAMYANEHGDRFPDDLETVLSAGDLSPEALVCPSSRDTPLPPSPTAQAIAAGLRYPGHCSYIYLGKGLTDQTVTPDTVLLYEPLADHGGEGMNVMFGDFHVEWIYASAAQAILTQHAASTQPIRLTIDSSGRHASIQR